MPTVGTKSALHLSSLFCTLSSSLFSIEEVVVLEPLVVEAQQLAPETSLSEIRYTDELALRNQTDVADLLTYLPNIDVIRPEIGSDESLIAVRDQSALSNGRLWVTVDGFPLSNLLEAGPQGAAQLNVVQPNEIESVKVLYGPFSAEYGGYALSGVIALQTKPILERSGSISAKYFLQDFDLYGTSEVYEGYQGEIRYQDRIGKLGFSITASQLENETQPARFISTTNLNTPPPAIPPPPIPVPVEGAYKDLDAEGEERITYGSQGSRDLSVNTLGFLADYALSDSMQLRLTSRYTQRESRQESVENYLSAAGDPAWGGPVIYNGDSFNVASNAFAHRISEKEQILNGIGLDGELENDWQYQLSLSAFHVLKDDDMVSNQNPLDPTYDESGRIETAPTAYWINAKAKFSTDSPFDRDDMHLAFGYEWNTAEFENEVHNSEDWDSGSEDVFRSSRGGATDLYAGFAELEWRPNTPTRFVVGLRAEQWDAHSGFADAITLGPPPTERVKTSYPSRTESNLSPKFAFEYELSNEDTLTFAAAQTHRYPLAIELFQELIDDDGVSIQSNPDLKPEVGQMFEMSWQRQVAGRRIRVTVFRNEIKDAILQQLEPPTRPGPASRVFVNVDEVVTNGLEFSCSQNNFIVKKLNGTFNLGYMDSTIEGFDQNTEVEGNAYPGVPEWRVSGTLRYRLNRDLELGLGARYQSHIYEQLDNSDDRDTIGGASEFLVFDCSLRYKIRADLVLSARIDNLLDEEYYANRTMPQRTTTVGLQWNF